MADSESDQQLVRDAQAGDGRAFAMLFDRHYKLMFKVAWQWCGMREDAEDIAQEAAIKFARNLGSFQFDAALTTWIYRLVINTAKDYYKAKNRRGSRELPLYEDVEFISDLPSPEEKLAQKDLLRAINGLPESLKETVLLVHGQGLSHRQAGEILDCSEGTISWRVHEARQKLAADFAPGKGAASHG